MTMAKRTIAAAAWSVSGRFLSRGVDLVTLFVLARLLTPADFGLVAIAMVLISIVEAVFELPLAQALMRLDTIGAVHLDTAFTLSMTRALVLGLLVSSLSWPFSLLYGDARLVPLVCVLSLAPAMRGMSSPGIVLRLKELDFTPGFKMELAGKLFGCAAAALLALLHFGYWAIAANTVVAPLVMSLVSYGIAPYRPRVTFKEWRSFSDFLGWASAAQLLSAFNWQCDRLVLARLIGRADVGRFAMASDLAGIPTQSLINPLISPILAAFTNLTGDRARLVAGYKRAASAITLIGMPLLVGIAVDAKSIVHFALGPQWYAAAPLLSLLSLQAVFTLFSAPLAPLVMSMGRTDLLLRQNVIEACVKIPAVVLGALLFGLGGVVAARLLAAAATAISAVVIVRGVLGYAVVAQMLNHWRQAASAAAMAGVLLLCARVSPVADNAAAEIAVSALLGGLVYGGAALALGIELRAYVPARFAAVLDRRVPRRWRLGRSGKLGAEPSA